MADKYKIVLVEDDQILSKIMKEELTEAGFELIQAFDGQQGLEAIKSHKPALVLLDIMMPKMDGFQALEIMKKDPEIKDIPVLILTVLDEEENTAKGMALGAAGYMIKSKDIHSVADVTGKVKEFLKIK